MKTLLDRDFAILQLNLGEQLYLAGNLEQSILYLQDALSTFQELEDWYNSLYTALKLSIELYEKADLQTSFRYAYWIYQITNFLLKDYPDDPDLISFKASALLRMGDASFNIGKPEIAEKFFFNSLKLLKPFSNDKQFKYDIFITLSKLVQLYQSLDSPNKLLYFSHLALSVYKDKKIIELEPETIHDIMSILQAYGYALEIKGKIKKALKIYIKSAQILNYLTQKYPQFEKFLQSFGTSLEYIGISLEHLGKQKVAIKIYQKYLEIKIKLFKQNPDSQLNAEGVAIAYERLIDLLYREQNLNQALIYAKKYWKFIKNWEQHSPDILSFKLSKAAMLYYIGSIFTEIGNYEKAEKLLLQSLINFYKLYENNNIIDTISGLVDSAFGLAQLYIIQGKLIKAKKFVLLNVKLSKQNLQKQGHNIWFYNHLTALYQLGEILYDLQDFQTSKQIFLYTLKLALPHYGKNEMVELWSLVESITFYLADIYRELNDLNSALKFAKLNYALAKKTFKLGKNFNSEHNFLKTVLQLAQIFIELQEYDQAKKLTAYALKNLIKLFNQTYDNDILNTIGIALERLSESYTDLEKQANIMQRRLKLAVDSYRSNPKNVEFADGLAVSYYKFYQILQKLNSPISNKIKIMAIKTLKKLVQNFSDNVKFKNLLSELNSSN